MDLDEALKLSEDMQKRLFMLAEEVQERLLPSTRPVIEGYTFFDYFQTHIARNYYDYIRLADGRLVVVIADVVVLGHGIVAAMLLAKLSGEVRFCLASDSDPAAAVTHLNERMRQFDLNRYMRFLMVSLDPDTHDVKIVNAGNVHPIHRHLDGSLSLPGKDAAHLPIGLMDDVEYVATTVTLQPGESLTLFTDGFEGAINMAGEPFTFDRICEIVAATNGDPTEIGNSLLTQVRQHLGDQPQDDDICLISFGRVPTAQVHHKGT